MGPYELPESVIHRTTELSRGLNQRLCGPNPRDSIYTVDLTITSNSSESNNLANRWRWLSPSCKN